MRGKGDRGDAKKFCIGFVLEHKSTLLKIGGKYIAENCLKKQTKVDTYYKSGKEIESSLFKKIKSGHIVAIIVEKVDVDCF